MVGVNIKTVRTYDPESTGRGKTIAAGKSSESVPDVDFYNDVLDLARWVNILFVYLHALPGDELCPECLFPPKLQPKRKSKEVTLKENESGDYQCPECGIVITNPLNWRGVY